MGRSTPPKKFFAYFIWEGDKNRLAHCRRFVAFESRVGRFFRVGLDIWSIFEHFDTLVIGIGNNLKEIESV